MSDPNSTDFFDNVGGEGAPSAHLSTPGDFVMGEIESMRKRDYTKVGKKEPERDDKGNVVQQLVIVLKTDQRNWVGVSKVPLIDRQDESKGHKPPSEDDGRRAVYVAPNTNIQFAIADAIRAAGPAVRPLVGGTLGVKVDSLRDVGQPQPMKVHKCIYKVPAASTDFFPQTPQQAAPAVTPAAAPAPTPEPQTAPVQAPPAAAPQVDPWAASPAPTTAPPF